MSAVMARPPIPQTEPERHAWIKWQLDLRGLSLSAVSRIDDLHRGAAQQALRRQYPRLEKTIANLLGHRPEEIWPERYDANGHPLRRPMGRPRKVVRHASEHTTAPGRRTPLRRAS